MQGESVLRVLNLKATDTKTLRTAAAEDVSVAAAEVQVASTAANHRTGPVEAAAACVDERTNFVGVAVIRS